jgi:hypothetical protein
LEGRRCSFASDASRSQRVASHGQSVAAHGERGTLVGEATRLEEDASSLEEDASLLEDDASFLVDRASFMVGDASLSIRLKSSAMFRVSVAFVRARPVEAMAARRSRNAAPARGEDARRGTGTALEVRRDSLEARPRPSHPI